MKDFDKFIEEAALKRCPPGNNSGARPPRAIPGLWGGSPKWPRKGTGGPRVKNGI